MAILSPKINALPESVTFLPGLMLGMNICLPVKNCSIDLMEVSLVAT